MGNCCSRQKLPPNPFGTSRPSDVFDTPAIFDPVIPPDSDLVTAPLLPPPRKKPFKGILKSTKYGKKTIGEPSRATITFQHGGSGYLRGPRNSISDGDGPEIATSDFLNGGYWPSWKYHEGISPSCVTLKNITHINYAFADIDGDGTVFLADEKVHFEALVDGADGALRAWTLKRTTNPNLNLKITLAIGGEGEEVAKKFADVASSRQKLYTFVESTKKLVEKFELDGVDIDWEYPNTAAEARHYLELLTELRRGLGWHRWVTTALPASKPVLEKLDLVEISKIVDFINLMAYDFVGPEFANVQKTGHHAALYHGLLTGENVIICGADAVDYMIERRVNSRKIMLGVPAYGRSFKAAHGADQPFQGPGSGIKATHEVKDLPRPGMTEYYDETAGAAYAAGQGEFITYDNKESVRQKARFVREKDLRGLFYWHLAGDRTGDASLVNGGFQILSKPRQRVGNPAPSPVPVISAGDQALLKQYGELFKPTQAGTDE